MSFYQKHLPKIWIMFPETFANPYGWFCAFAFFCSLGFQH